MEWLPKLLHSHMGENAWATDKRWSWYPGYWIFQIFLIFIRKCISRIFISFRRQVIIKNIFEIIFHLLFVALRSSLWSRADVVQGFWSQISNQLINRTFEISSGTLPWQIEMYVLRQELFIIIYLLTFRIFLLVSIIIFCLAQTK